MSYLEQLLRHHLTDWRSGWSMGTFGAIAEFHQDDGEVAVIDDTHLLTRATRRGGIRVDRGTLSELVPVAYETLSPKRHRWSQAVALCLPEVKARRGSRSVLSEIGPDDHAIRGIDRTGILFDMGLSLPQCDFCIRTSEPKLLAVLRANLGRSLFEHGNEAMPAILAVHPHRIALTNIGRVEVYQKIGGPDTGGGFSRGTAYPSAAEASEGRPHAFGQHANPLWPVASRLAASGQSGHRSAGQGPAVRPDPA
ncbi:hypothetical protein SLT36_30545 (plasmid) [Aminobacter sp. BA135]